MTEYHYYEFQAVDRPLRQQEQAELRRMAPRSTLTAYRLSHVYRHVHPDWKPEPLLERCFDAYLHLAHVRRGERVLMLRLPRRTLEAKRVAPYLCEGVGVRAVGDKVLLSFRALHEQPGDWGDEEEWMPALLPLRGELLAGDLRCLYVGWLASAQWGELDVQEPPPPPGLEQPSAALGALAQFLLVDPDLLAVAAEASPHVAPVGPSGPLPRRALSAWLATLPVREKDELLLRAAEGEATLSTELLQRFKEGRGPEAGGPGAPRRTVRQLLEAAEQRRAERQWQVAERWARAETWRRKEQAETREKALEALATREGGAWQEVEAHFASGRPQRYEKGVQVLVDLRELARRQGRLALFRQRLRQLRLQHARKRRLISRLDMAGLGPQ